jgi:hypothetical protein
VSKAACDLVPAFTPDLRYPKFKGPLVSEAAIPSYMEIIDFIASGTTPQAVADYRPSREAQHRVAELIAREKEGGLSAEEKSELDHFMDLEHILRVAKARARQILASGS